MSSLGNLTSKISFTISALACVLMCSFFMHTVQVQHVHPGSHADAHEEKSVGTLSEYVHGGEKKLFVFTLMSFLFLGAYIAWSANVSLIFLHIHLYERCKLLKTKVIAQLFCYLQYSFSRGLLNPRPY